MPPVRPCPGDANGHADAPQPELTAEERLAELEAKHAELSDAYLRAKAEAENTRRRAEEEDVQGAQVRGREASPRACCR